MNGGMNFQKGKGERKGSKYFSFLRQVEFI